MRAAVAQWHAEALRRADGDVRAERTRRLQQDERQRIHAERHHRATRVHPGDERGRIGDVPQGVRVLQVRAEELAGVEPGGGVRDDERHPEPARASAHHRDHLGVAGGIHEVRPVGAFRRAQHESHRLGCGGGFVEERRVRHRQSRQIDQHLLERRQRLQPALGDLRLVRRVGRVPTRILENVALNHGWRMRVAIAGPDKAAPHLVAGGERAQLGERLRFGARRRKVERDGLPYRIGQRFPDERFARGETEGVEHVALVARVDSDVARGKGAGVQQIVERHGRALSSCRGLRDRRPRPAGSRSPTRQQASRGTATRRRGPC